MAGMLLSGISKNIKIWQFILHSLSRSCDLIIHVPTKITQESASSILNSKMVKIFEHVINIYKNKIRYSVSEIRENSGVPEFAGKLEMIALVRVPIACAYMCLCVHLCVYLCVFLCVSVTPLECHYNTTVTPLWHNCHTIPAPLRTCRVGCWCPCYAAPTNPLCTPVCDCCHYRWFWNLLNIVFAQFWHVCYTVIVGCWRPCYANPTSDAQWAVPCRGD
jgi:hypothetical protein